MIERIAAGLTIYFSKTFEFLNLFSVPYKCVLEFVETVLTTHDLSLPRVHAYVRNTSHTLSHWKEKPE
jgi:hypothetical protein